MLLPSLPVSPARASSKLPEREVPASTVVFIVDPSPAAPFNTLLLPLASIVVLPKSSLNVPSVVESLTVVDAVVDVDPSGCPPSPEAVGDLVEAPSLAPSRLESGATLDVESREAGCGVLADDDVVAVGSITPEVPAGVWASAEGEADGLVGDPVELPVAWRNVGCGVVDTDPDRGVDAPDTGEAEAPAAGTGGDVVVALLDAVTGTPFAGADSGEAGAAVGGLTELVRVTSSNVEDASWMPLDSSGAGASEGKATSVEGVGGGTGGVAVVPPAEVSESTGGLAVSPVTARNVGAAVIGMEDAGVEAALALLDAGGPFSVVDSTGGGADAATYGLSELRVTL
jgi:hypothetical protein